MLPSLYKMKRLYEMRQMLRLKLETTDVGGNQPKTDKSMSLKGGQEVALRRSYPTKCCYTDEWVIRKREMCAGRDTGRICQRGPLQPCIYNVPEFYSAGPIVCTRSIMDIWIKIPDSKGGTILFRGTNIGSASVDKSQLQVSTSMRHTEHMVPANQRAKRENTTSVFYDSCNRLGQRICSTAPSLQRRLSYEKRMSFRSYTTDVKGSKSSDENVLNQKVQSEKPADAHKDAVNTRNPFQDGTPWERRLYSIMKVPNVRRVQDLFALITKHEDLWEAAYKRLAWNEGSMTSGTDGGTIDGVSKQLLNALRISVKDGKYKFGEVKRVLGSERLRPLGIPTFQDRLVQEVIRIALEACYEPIFSPNSHGFRPRKSQHTCLRQVRRDFSGVNWVIEGDISKCFDTINHKILIKLLRQRIEDHKFVNLIEKILRTSETSLGRLLRPLDLKTLTVLPTGEKEKGIAGTPQGLMVSPVLYNICLNTLDKFVERLQRIINRGKGRREKKEYSRVIAALSRNRAKKKKIEDTVGRQNVPIALTKEVSRLAREGRSITRKGGIKDPNDSNFRRLVYVRYVDDFLIGIAGPKKLAERVKSLIFRFLKQKLSLTLSSEKTHITAFRENRVPFLGYNIGKHLGLKVVKKKKKGTALKVRATLSSKSIMLLADTPKVIRKLKEKGFCDGNGVPKPNFVFAYQHPQSWTISRAASFIRGITNYYHLADNKRGLVSRIVYIIRSSIAKTWAAKFKLGSQKAVMKIAGRDLRRMSLYNPRGEKLPIGATDSKLVRVGTEAGSKINVSVEKLPYLPFTKYRDITPPGGLQGAVANIGRKTTFFKNCCADRIRSKLR
uniref:Reverse transcriptase domain-containing protein n=1 Tax=Coleochaete scutata TaxID=3125 RepID=A0A5P9NW19_COLSC|nr:hypothetical protein [Coleochaete scutata]QFU80159.1 hypothetical protein [Coleochaete scutata]